MDFVASGEDVEVIAEKLLQAADSVPPELAEYARDLYRLLMAQSRTYQEELLSGEVE